MANVNLSAAKAAKNDEFYTQLAEIQAELKHYKDKFAGKTVFCNCDDPFESNFVKYFLMNFNALGLKELIATGYKVSPVQGTEIGMRGEPYALRVTDTSSYLCGTQTDLDVAGAKRFLESERAQVMTPLAGNWAKDSDGNVLQISVKEEYLDEKTGKMKKRTVKQDLYYEAGDFRSDMSVALLKEADIVVTNPPFSLFREYVGQLMEHGKQFLIIGNKNAIAYKEIFPLLKNNEMWMGYCQPTDFILANGTLTKQVSGLCRWFTNLDHAKRHQMLPLDLGFTYYGHEEDYPRYDNYDAINVDKVCEIPCDYVPCWYNCKRANECKYAKSDGKVNAALCEALCNGQMGVPITYLDKHCSEQFDIVGADFDLAAKVDLGDGKFGTGRFYVTNSAQLSSAQLSRMYSRIVIRRKKV